MRIIRYIKILQINISTLVVSTQTTLRNFVRDILTLIGTLNLNERQPVLCLIVKREKSSNASCFVYQFAQGTKKLRSKRQTGERVNALISRAVIYLITTAVALGAFVFFTTALLNPFDKI